MKRSKEQKQNAADSGGVSEMDSLFALLGLLDPYCDAPEPAPGEPGDWLDDLILMEELLD